MTYPSRRKTSTSRERRSLMLPLGILVLFLVGLVTKSQSRSGGVKQRWAALMAKETRSDGGGGVGHNVVLSGIVQDVPGEHLRYQIAKMVQLGRSLASPSGKFHILVYENDSRNNNTTRDALRTLLDDKPYATYVYEDGLDTKVGGGSRTSRMAMARNRMMEVFEERVLGDEDDYEYLLVTDMDGVCGGSDDTKSFDPDIFRYALSRQSEWDAMFFRFVPYWDLWAFRHELWMPENRAGSHRRSNAIQTAQQLDRTLDRYRRTELIPVQSAFMMMGVYKISVVRGMRYSGVDIHGEEDCEHAPFHQELRQERDARLRLLPMVYCEGDPGYFPLDVQLSM